MALKIKKEDVSKLTDFLEHKAQFAFRVFDSNTDGNLEWIDFMQLLNQATAHSHRVKKSALDNLRQRYEILWKLIADSCDLEKKSRVSFTEFAAFWADCAEYIHNNRTLPQVAEELGSLLFRVLSGGEQTISKIRFRSCMSANGEPRQDADMIYDAIVGNPQESMNWPQHFRPVFLAMIASIDENHISSRLLPLWRCFVLSF